MAAMPLRQPNSFTLTAPEVVQFRPPGLAATDRLNIKNIRRMQREYPLNTFVSGKPANSKRLVYAAPSAGDHDTGKYLHTALGTFGNLTMHIDRITYLKIGCLVFKALAFH